MVHKNSVSIATTGNVIRPVDASYWNLFLSGSYYGMFHYRKFTIQITQVILVNIELLVYLCNLW